MSCYQHVPKIARASVLQYYGAPQHHQILVVILQEQQDAIGINLSMFDQTPAPGPDPNEALADQMLNVTKAEDEYDPEDLYDPSEGP